MPRSLTSKIICAIQEERGLTLRQFADKVGITHVRAGDILRGKVDPEADLLPVIASVLGVDVATLTRGPLKPRDDWELAPPDDSGKWFAVAYCIGGPDGWDLFWSDDSEDPCADGSQQIPWPFEDKGDNFESAAFEEDFEAAGFQVHD